MANNSLRATAVERVTWCRLFRRTRAGGAAVVYLGQRTMVAGMLPNSPDHLALWIEHPRSVNPKTAMPDLGLTSDQAYDIAACLYTVQGPEGNLWSHCCTYKDTACLSPFYLQCWRRR